MSSNLAYTLGVLQQAFPAVPLELPGLADLAGKTWRELPAEALEAHREAVERAPQDAFFALVPALLAAALRDTLGLPPKLVARGFDRYSLLSDLTCTRLTRGKYRPAAELDRAVAALSGSQRHAIALALAAIELELQAPCGWDDVNGLGDEAGQALDSYWRPLVSDDDRDRLHRQMNAPSPELARALQALDETFPARPLDRPEASVPAGYLSLARLEADRRGKTWKDLDPAFLRCHHDLLPFLDAGGIADYLPAFLSAVLWEMLDRGPDLDVVTASTIAELTRSERHAARFDRQLAALPLEQQRAIAIALSALERVEGSVKTDVRQALDSYWSQFLQEGDAS